MNQVLKTIPQVDEALRALALEMEKLRNGSEALDSHRNLAFLWERLTKIREDMMSGTKPVDDRFKGSMTHIINDTWPRESALGEQIAQIEYNYYRQR